MSPEFSASLDSIVQQLARKRQPAVLDLYVTRIADCWWRVEQGRVVSRRVLLREGAAVRSVDSLRSADGLDRRVLAELLGVPPRAFPPPTFAPFPAAPDSASFLRQLSGISADVHWRGSWAAVVTARETQQTGRPQLFGVRLADGQHHLSTWPLPPGWTPPVPAPRSAGTARPGITSVLLAPPAAAVLLHELLGHALEGDLLLRGTSPWAGRQGERIFSLPLDVVDDPTLLHLPGGFTADDEGVPARPRPLLRDGVLAGALADRATAAALGVPAGSARRASLHTPPRPRMSNLVARSRVAASEPPRREARIEVESLASGTLEPRLGVVILAARTAFSLRRGERFRPLAPFTLVGKVAALQEGLLAAGASFGGAGQPGWCNKDGEVVPTGATVPWLLVSGLEVR